MAVKVLATPGNAAGPMKVIVRCATHGPMSFHHPCMWWICAGFDGEGCPAQITAEDVRRATGAATPPGTVCTELELVVEGAN